MRSALALVAIIAACESTATVEVDGLTFDEANRCWSYTTIAFPIHPWNRYIEACHNDFGWIFKDPTGRCISLSQSCSNAVRRAIVERADGYDFSAAAVEDCESLELPGCE